MSDSTPLPSHDTAQPAGPGPSSSPSTPTQPLKKPAFVFRPAEVKRRLQGNEREDRRSKHIAPPISHSSPDPAEWPEDAFVPRGRKFPVSPSMVGYDGKMFGGTAPAYHPRRCQGAKRLTCPPKQCARWALVDEEFCKFHGPNTHKVSRTRRGIMLTMTNRYMRKASLTLQTVVNSMAKGVGDKHSLSDEVDLARVLLARAVDKYDVACVDPETSKDVDPRVKAAAANLLKEAVSHVADVVRTASNVRANEKSIFDAELVAVLSRLIAQAVLNEIGDEHPALANRVLAAIGNVKIPRRFEDMSTDEVAEQAQQVAAAMESAVPSALPENAGS